MKSMAFRFFFFAGLITATQGSQAEEPVKLSPHTDVITSLLFSPDGKWLASASFDSTVRLFDAQQGKELAVIQLASKPHAVAFSPDTRHLAVALVGSEVEIWEVATRKRVRQLGGHHKYVLDVVFSQDGQMLASVDGAGKIRLWDTGNWTVTKTFTSPNQSWVFDIDLSPDGKWLAASTDDAVGHVWNLNSGKLHATINPKLNGKLRSTINPEIKWDRPSHEGSVSFSPDSKSLATTSSYIIGGAHIYGIENLDRPRANHVIPWTASGWSNVSFTPDGKEVLCATGYWYVSLWNPLQNKQKQSATSIRTGEAFTLWSRDKQGDHFINQIAVTPDGKKLAYSGSPRLVKGEKPQYFIKLWNLSDFRKAVRKQYSD